MKKLLIRIGIFLISIVIVLVVYLSFFGIKTNSFNQQIENKIKQINKNFEIELQDINIVLNLSKLKFNLKTLGTNLKYKNREIQLEKIESGISLKTILKNNFLLEELEISTKAIKIKDLISFFRVINNDPKLFIAEQFIKKGYILADINIELDERGRIKENINISGYLKDGSINTLRQIDLSKIDLSFNFSDDELQLRDFSLLLNNKKFLIPKIDTKKIGNKFLIKGEIVNKKIVLQKNDFKKLINIKDFNLDIDKIEFTSENNFSFEVDRNFNFDKFNFKSSLNLEDLSLKKEFDLKKIFPQYNNEINLQKHNIKLEYQKDLLKIEGEGEFLIKESDKIKYKIEKKKDDLNFETTLNISNNNLKLDILNYQKKNTANLKLNIKGNQDSNKNIIFKNISLIENNNIINIKDLLIKNFNKIKTVEKIKLDYTDSDNLKNKVTIAKKNNSYIVEGEAFNGNKLLENLLKSKSQSKNFFSEKLKIFINIKNINLDKDNNIKDLNGFLILKNNIILEADLDSKFLNQKKIKFTVRNIENEKITTFFSGEAKPFINRYKFIKGFDEGSLDFYSVSKNNISISTLKIYDFKLKELPALTKILTLASLQGIADVLTGEGIRFNEFEMNFSNKDQLMTIDEIYAIGPAISILMDGYVESDKLVSLRGTLVPATTLNKVIGSIPFLGDLLVGKKTGEGVFGVSFKIKGPPDKLETSVNPIKTITPRFITRTLEKIKKN
jgi:hypothetical protein